MSDPILPIRPEILAAKIEKIENFEQPRLLDEFAANPRLLRALWFIQWASQPANYPGGLSKFAADLVGASEVLIGTASMTQARTRGDKFSPADATAIFSELTSSAREEIFGQETSWLIETFLPDEKIFSQEWLGDAPSTRSRSATGRRDATATLVTLMTASKLRSVLLKIAERKLPAFLKEVCELPHVGFVPCSARSSDIGAPWYFVRIAEALLAFVEARACRVRAQLAETAVTKEVRRWIHKSRAMKRPVMFVGNSRFGKTETAKFEAAADPGNCRFINTPSSNAISDLLREVAKTLGIEVGPQSAGRELRERIDYVLRFSGLQLIFDESQRLLPGNYSRNTAPARLNWVRGSIIDQGTPAVFVCTPQSYLPAKTRFVKVTGFAMEQWDERLITRNLPNELSEEDLLAVARIHFANLDEDYLHFVVDTVLATERNFVSDIEKIAALAKDNARESGRSKTLMADIEAAIAVVLPAAPAAPLEPPKPGKNSSVQPRCRNAAAVLRVPRKGLEISNRTRFSRAEEVPV